MGICWYCYWGWSKPVADIYLEALNRLNGDEMPLCYSFAHIVWADENFDSADWCLNEFEKHKEEYIGADYTESQLDIVKWSLEELNKLPLSIREIIPKDYDDEHPELYPPQTSVVRIK